MAQGDPLDYHVDIYELGIVLYQMLTGHVPFTGSSPYAIVIQHIQNNLPLIHRSNPNIPAAVDDVLQKATAKQPTERFATAGAMALALRKAIQQLPGQSRTPVGLQQTVSTNLLASAPSMPPHQSQTPADQQQTVSANLLASTPSMPPPQAGHQGTPQRPVAPPVMVNQAPANRYMPAAQAHDVSSTLADNQSQPAPYQFAPQRAADTKRNGRWIMLIVALVILMGGGILTTTLLYKLAQQNEDITAGTPRVQQSPTVSSQTSLPEGAQLYSTTMPAPPPCNKTDASWTVFRGSFDCGSTALHITGKAGTTRLGGTLLNQLPDGRNYPNDYVVQAHIMSVGPSTFGICFRNQPGGFQIGAYAFLVSPDGTWQANVYDKVTGSPRQLKSGTQTVSKTDTWLTLAVVVKGANFSFYVNNILVGTMQDNTYPTGMAGIAVDHDGEIVTDQFSLHTTSS
jgi:hypothetical protein